MSMKTMWADFESLDGHWDALANGPQFHVKAKTERIRIRIEICGTPPAGCGKSIGYKE
jgi:hypothetical protein